jgi:hypothetical protein
MNKSKFLPQTKSIRKQLFTLIINHSIKIFLLNYFALMFSFRF